MIFSTREVLWPSIGQSGKQTASKCVHWEQDIKQVFIYGVFHLQVSKNPSSIRGSFKMSFNLQRLLVSDAISAVISVVFSSVALLYLCCHICCRGISLPSTLLFSASSLANLIFISISSSISLSESASPACFGSLFLFVPDFAARHSCHSTASYGVMVT